MAAFCVITTINPPTEAVRALARHFPGRMIVIGDTKTPPTWRLAGASFFAVDEQDALRFASVTRTPIAHYARKNLGYLLAMKRGASVVYDTDDDNTPNAAWRVRSETCFAATVTRRGWCNVYSLVGEGHIWPRGFPLGRLGDETPAVGRLRTVANVAPIQQGLAAGSPDVDAIWRLTMPRHVRFAKEASIVLGAGVWCPFNSQTTWWWPDVYPLLYLPVHATFRMTDIWRSFVAQRCLWEMGRRVAFHSPAEVVQHRNPHDLMRDFADEIPGYLHNEAIAHALARARLTRGRSAVLSNLRACYVALIGVGFLPAAELASVDAWIADVRAIRKGR